MNAYHNIENVVHQLKNEYDWNHSFVRELYINTQKHFSKINDYHGNSMIGVVSGNRNARAVVASSGNRSNTGIEFIFQNIKIISINSFDELKFDYNYNKNDGHIINFSHNFFVISDHVKVKFLGLEYLGSRNIIGHEYESEIIFTSTQLDDSWRQCLECYDAWEESPSISLSRCSNCGRLTKLDREPGTF